MTISLFVKIVSYFVLPDHISVTHVAFCCYIRHFNENGSRAAVEEDLGCKLCTKSLCLVLITVNSQTHLNFKTHLRMYVVQSLYDTNCTIS